jgi:hypothetical protein
MKNEIPVHQFGADNAPLHYYSITKVHAIYDGTKD